MTLILMLTVGVFLSVQLEMAVLCLAPMGSVIAVLSNICSAEIFHGCFINRQLI